MKRQRFLAFFLIGLVLVSQVAWAQDDGQWHGSGGARFFKYSVENGPNEIADRPVLAKWENIRRDHTDYTVKAYEPLTPLFFNFSFGIDLFFRHGDLMLKLGYDYSDPCGIGGKGRIVYTNNATGETITETKQFAYTTHQVNLFIGPVLDAQNRADFYMGFCPMAPTWVNYTERYQKSVDNKTVIDESKTWRGAFGNCRALIGAEAPVDEKWKLGSEAAFSFLNYMELTSGDLVDRSFQFPAMKWNITARRDLF